MALPTPVAGAVMIYDSVSGGIISSNGYASPLVMPPLPSASDLNGIHNFNSSSLTPGGVAGTYYYLSGSGLTMPATYMQGIVAGTTFVWRIKMSKTAAGTGAFNIGIYMGTNGSISDTRKVTQSIGTATAALDDLTLDIVLTFTSTTAAYWSISAQHSAATATGFGVATGSASFSGTLTGLTATTGSLIFGIGYSNTTGTAVITVSQVQAYALGVA